MLERLGSVTARVLETRGCRARWKSESSSTVRGGPRRSGAREDLPGRAGSTRDARGVGIRADITTGAIALDGYARVNARALARAMSGHPRF
mmetsp:Transcript_7342/g.32452  ORF Transcript_7342/g.32452 Transcript_7342/m.32452 type:complete len:91 (-) Transcript_7342:54-326(-)